jgi:hypothetical protein
VRTQLVDGLLADLLQDVRLLRVYDQGFLQNSCKNAHRLHLRDYFKIYSASNKLLGVPVSSYTLRENFTVSLLHTMLVTSSSLVKLLNETISFLRFARWLMFFSRVRPQSWRFNVVMFFVDSTEQCFNKISSVNSSNLKKQEYYLNL